MKIQSYPVFQSIRIFGLSQTIEILQFAAKALWSYCGTAFDLFTTTAEKGLRIVIFNITLLLTIVPARRRFFSDRRSFDGQAPLSKLLLHFKSYEN